MGGEIDKETSSSFIQAFFEAVGFAFFLGLIALVGVKGLEHVQTVTYENQKTKISPMEYSTEDESEMNIIRTRSSYLR